MEWLDIFGVFKSAWYGVNALLVQLDTFVYGFICSLYKIFMALAGAKLLSADAYMTIANKLYMIIGVVMLFVLSYGLVRAIINPDEATKGEMGGPKIVKAIIVAVVGLAVTPVVFELMYKGQSVFLENDVLAALFFRSDKDTYDYKTIVIPASPTNTDTGSATNASSDGIDVYVGEVEYNKEIKNVGGAVTATAIWQNFFRPKQTIFTENYSESPKYIKADISKYYKNAATGWEIGCAVGLVGAGILIALSLVSFGTTAIIAGAVGVTACGVGIISNEVKAAQFSGTEITLEEAYIYSGATGDFSIYQVFIPNIVDENNEGKNEDTGQTWKGTDIEYIWFFSTLVGLFVCYCFLTFSIDLAVRAAKLAYYQIIAPIPLILQIVPKFQKVWKDYISSVISTFLEVFIRISVVYIIIYFICHLGDVFNFGDALSGVNLNPLELTLASVIMILGLIAFARSAPKLISETFGLKTGSLDFGIRKKLADGGLFSAGAIVGSAATGLVRNANNTFRDNRAAGYGRIRSGIRAAGSAIGGAGSAAARSTYRQFFAPNHHEAHDFREMRDSASKAAEDASNARVRRRGRHSDVGQAFQRNVSAAGDTAYKNYLDRNPGDVAGAEAARNRATARAQRSFARRAFVNLDVRSQGMRDSISAWAGGTIDTSYMDGYSKSMTDLSGLQGTLEESFFKDKTNQAQSAENKLKTLQAMDPKQFAYFEHLRKDAETRIARRAGESADDYKNRIDVEVKRMSSDKHYLNINDYALDPSSPEFNDAQQKLSDAISAAQSAFDDAKRDYVARSLAEYAMTGVHNDVSSALTKFMSSHQGDLRKYQNEKFLDGTFGEYMTNYFGGSVLTNGSVDLAALFKSNHGGASGELDMDTKLEGRVMRGGHEVNVKYTVHYDKVDKSFSIIDEATGTSVNGQTYKADDSGAISELHKYIEEHIKGVSIKGTRSQNNENVKASTNAMKDDTKNYNRKYMDSDEWTDSHSRQQQQRERQQNNNGGH